MITDRNASIARGLILVAALLSFGLSVGSLLRRR